MSIFKEMHAQWQFDSQRDFAELQRMLEEAINRGHVEEVPVMVTREVRITENWYRDKETGEIYSLVPPDPPARGSWQRIDPEELKRSNHSVQ
jgi:hypothetical protein